MNSVVQCLSNTPLLRSFMLSGAVTHEINRASRLGCNGRIADAFQKVIADLWSQQHVSFAPYALKSAIDRYRAQFSGGEQHDAQEVSPPSPFERAVWWV